MGEGADSEARSSKAAKVGSSIEMPPCTMGRVELSRARPD